MLKSYSHSSINTYKTCPRKFKFAYIEKPDVVKLRRADAITGTIVHDVLEDLYKHGSDGILLSIDDVRKLYKEAWSLQEKEKIGIVKDTYTVDDYIRIGLEMLERYYEKYKPFNQGTLIDTELNISFELDGTPFKIKARIDKLVKHDDGHIEIADYKTGKSFPRPTDPAFINQMGLYQLSVMANYPQFKDIELVQYFLRVDEEVRYRMSDDELDVLKVQIRNLVYETIQSEKTDNFPTKESPLCDYCDYFEICPAKKHRKLVEKSEKEDISDERRGYQLATEYVELNQEQKLAKTKIDSLKKDILDICRENDWNLLVGESGDLSVSINRAEKFVTKTEDPDAFAALSFLARELELDEYMKLDGNALMKQVYQKNLLSQEALDKLEKYVIEKEETRVTVKKKKKKEEL